MSVAPALNLNNGEKKLKEIIDKRTKLTVRCSLTHHRAHTTFCSLFPSPNDQ